MSNEIRSSSILTPFIIGMLEEKRSLGFDYRTEELILLRFDRYCIEQGLDTISISKSFLDDWCMRSDTEGLSNQRKRITVVRQLMLYMLSLGIMVYLPKSVEHRWITLPHIFTTAELQSLFCEVDAYEPACNRPDYRRLAKEYQVLFRMLYCCGLRNSECCGLATDQVNLEKGVLTIRGSKGKKDRLVYMADDLVQLCVKYYRYLCDELASCPRWFFPGIDPEKPIKNTSIDRVFNRFWFRTPLSETCNNKPTVHDLRFTFVTDRINQWTLQGTNVAVMMPYLLKYLGHKGLQDSYYYYHISGQLYDSIRHMDKTANTAIPEVPDYE